MTMEQPSWDWALSYFTDVHFPDEQEEGLSFLFHFFA